MQALDLAVFDLAGTTVEDNGQVPGAFSAALADFGIQVTREQIQAVRGASKRSALRRLIPPGPQQERLSGEAYDAFKTHLAQSYAVHGVQAIPGAEDVFHFLRECGARVALNTGFDRDITALLLDALGWTSGVVDAVVCGEEVPLGRPAPYLIFRAMEATGTLDVHRVAVVGDTTLDLQAGYNAGVRWNIGVLTGAHDRLTLEAAPHTHLISSVAELIQIWTDS